jgi:hypothetical protein
MLPLTGATQVDCAKGPPHPQKAKAQVLNPALSPAFRIPFDPAIVRKLTQQ